MYSVYPQNFVALYLNLDFTYKSMFGLGLGYENSDLDRKA